MLLGISQSVTQNSVLSQNLTQTHTKSLKIISFIDLILSKWKEIGLRVTYVAVSRLALEGQDLIFQTTTKQNRNHKTLIRQSSTYTLQTMQATFRIKTWTVNFTHQELEESWPELNNLSQLRKILFGYWSLLGGTDLQYTSCIIYSTGKYTAAFPIQTSLSLTHSGYPCYRALKRAKIAKAAVRWLDSPNYTLITAW